MQRKSEKMFFGMDIIRTTEWIFFGIFFFFFFFPSRLGDEESGNKRAREEDDGMREEEGDNDDEEDAGEWQFDCVCGLRVHSSAPSSKHPQVIISYFYLFLFYFYLIYFRAICLLANLAMFGRICIAMLSSKSSPTTSSTQRKSFVADVVPIPRRCLTSRPEPWRKLWSFAIWKL